MGGAKAGYVETKILHCPFLREGKNTTMAEKRARKKRV